MKFNEQFKCHCGAPMLPIELKQGMRETDKGMEQWITYGWICSLCGNEVRSSNQKMIEEKTT